MSSNDFDLDILPVKQDGTEQKLRKEIHPNLPQIASGQVGILISPVKTGKSTIISNLLLNPNFYKDCFDMVYIISNTINNDRTSRFLKTEFPHTIFDDLTKIDEIITNIIDYQDTFPRGEKPFICIVLDDFLGIKKNSKINYLATRARHYNIGLLLFASQLFRGLETTIRQNATFAIIGSPNPNEKEIMKISEEYSDQFGGAENFKKLYKEASKEQYGFLYLDLQSNPSRAYSKFNRLIYEKNSNTEGDGFITNIHKEE
jgi:hypothetical protein|tara:strand:- start:62 stop:838 length:777 start_codon:yes stop_codon:yes gene_type:complete